MQLFSDYWLAILVAAVAVFLVSSILHMVLPIHRADFKKLPHESEILEGLRTKNLAPGAYSFPCPQSMKDMSSPEMIDKYNLGPVGTMTILPTGVPAIGKSLVLWFLYSMLISFFIAYVASIGLSSDASSMTVFRLTSTVGVLAYGLGHLNESIWKGQSWTTSGKFLFDGVVYAIVTAAVFTWLR